MNAQTCHASLRPHAEAHQHQKYPHRRRYRPQEGKEGLSQHRQPGQTENIPGRQHPKQDAQYQAVKQREYRNGNGLHQGREDQVHVGKVQVKKVPENESDVRYPGSHLGPVDVQIQQTEDGQHRGPRQKGRNKPVAPAALYRNLCPLAPCRPSRGTGGVFHHFSVHFNSSFRSFPVIWSTTMTIAAISRMIERAIS